MNFALILFLLTVFTGIMYVLEKVKFLPERRRRADALARNFESANREAIDRGEKQVIDARNALYAETMREPWWLDYTAGLFPVIAIVFLLRSFLFEPFRIPSGSMLPTLYIGDFILVNKYDYGIRLPVINTKVIEVGAPKRGDIVVFRYPMDESIDYIKRVVGVPGDTVAYIDKKLTINGEPVSYEGAADWVDPFTMVTPAWVRGCADVPTTAWATDAATAKTALCAACPRASTSSWATIAPIPLIPATIRTIPRTASCRFPTWSASVWSSIGR